MAKEQKKRGLKGFFEKMNSSKSLDSSSDDIFNDDTYKEENDYGGSDDYSDHADSYGADNSESYDDNASLEIGNYLGEVDSGLNFSDIVNSNKSKEIIRLKDFSWKMYAVLAVEIVLVLYTIYVLIFL